MPGALGLLLKIVSAPDFREKPVEKRVKFENFYFKVDRLKLQPSGWSKRVEGVPRGPKLINKIVSAPDFRGISVEKRVKFENFYVKVDRHKLQLSGWSKRVERVPRGLGLLLKIVSAPDFWEKPVEKRVKFENFYVKVDRRKLQPSGWSKRVEGVPGRLGLLLQIVSAPDFRGISVEKRVNFGFFHVKVVYLKIAQLGGPLARV